MPPQRRKSGPSGPPRRRPKVAGSSRPPRMTPADDERSDAPDRSIVSSDAASSSPEPVRPAEVNLEKPEKTVPRTESEVRAETGSSAIPREPANSPDRPAGDTGDIDAPQGGSGGWRPVVVVGAVAVVLAAVAAVAAFRPGAEVSNAAWVDTAATQEVTEAAKVAIETMHGYDYRTIDEDFAQIRELLTPERLEEFDSTADVTAKAAVDTRTVTEVMVEHIGATMLDDTHAEVAAYINVSATGDGIAQGSAAAPLLVRMEKSDGRWLVSEIRDR
ncbi:hypothetical protein [Rhodococcus gordoniae]|uniref:hypothetical protein n=2 Tax=Rhodococcus TaxID=1827 RepID=UPI00102130EB